MKPRFARAERFDLRKEKGDLKDCNAWFDHSPRWDQADLRFFPMHVNPIPQRLPSPGGSPG